jgi:maltose alpha-D-glucosyltransferase / alpha-amylase
MGDTNHDDPLWYRDAVIYQLHVKAFADSDGDGVGDFGGLTSKLDYLHDLGVTAVWLLPFYPSPLRDDGYDIADYEGVHPAYGDLPAFRRFLREAHARGLRVITELVINHTSDEHAWFQRARRAPKGSTHRDFYVWRDTPDGYPEARVIFQDFESSNWKWDNVAGQHFWHRFYSHQPDLNFDNSAVHRAVFRVLDKWLGMGVDGVRLDAIPYLYEREGTNCENLPETHAFLRQLRAHINARYPNRLLLAEANQWPEDAVAYFGGGDGDECNMAFHFPVMPRLYMALQMEDRRPIVDILEQTPPIPATAQWAMFLRNHDELTLEMVTDEERDYMYRAYASDPQTRINLGIRRRLAPLLQKDRRTIELLNALLFSLPGTPVLYYGDEIGMGDNVYLGDRDSVRTPMQWSADRNAGFSRANPQQLYLPVIIDPQYHYETINVEAQRSSPSSLWWWMHRLIALRTRHRVFGRGDLEFLHPENPKVLAFIRSMRGEDGDEEDILVIANLSRYAQAVELDLSSRAGATPVELFGNTPFAAIGEFPYYLTLAPYGFYWFRLTPKPVEPVRARPRADLPMVTLPATAGRVDGRSRVGLERALTEWMPRRRWFAGKSRAIRSLSVEDSIELTDGQGGWPAELLLVSVEYAQGEPELYSVPVCVVSGDDADGVRSERPDLVIARVKRRENQAGSGPALLVDALAEPAVTVSLAQIAVRPRPRRGARGEVRGASTPSLRQLVRSGKLDVSMLGGEQSNTSVLIGDRAILKLYRRLAEGVSPDLEVGRHLQGRFDSSPSLLGSVEYQRRRGEPITLAVVHDFVPNEGDAWSYALDRLTGYYERVLARPESLDPADFSTDLYGPVVEASPLVHDLFGPFFASAELLGRRTAEMHMALASGDDAAFAPEPFTRLYQRSLYQSILNEVRATLRALRGRRASLPPELEGLLDDHFERRIFTRLEQLRSRRIDTVRTRVHGDYHLGQVLWNGADFVVIDFEGEPDRSVGQRRLKRPPVRDVAGMLRSFDYAAQVGLRQLVELGLVPDFATAAERLGDWGRLWTAWVGRRFLDGYLATAAGEPFIPDEEDDRRLLLDLFLLEKACYEVRYELDHRPDWVAIPLHSLADLVASFPDPESA